VLNDPTGYSTLGLVGIDLEDDGTLSIDSDDLEEKLAGDPEAFAALFTDLSSGVLVKLDDALDGLLDGATLSGSNETLDSVFTGRRKALGSILSSIDDQVERLQYNLERFEEALVQRFANLESIVGGLNSQSAFLAANSLNPR
jgi:flagellar hook-associated protein 2